MRLWNAIVGGLKPGRETLLPALLFWLGSLLPSWLGTAPIRSGLHAALDRSTAAAEISSGGGMDLLTELGMRQPGLWAAGFALLGPALVVSLALGFFAASGTYARAVAPEGSPWTRFWGQGARFLLPAAVVVLLNGLVWGAFALLPAAILGGVAVAFKEATDPGIPWNLFRIALACALVVLALFRGGAGFGRAWCARAGKTTNPAKAFLKGLGFTVRHLPQTQAITWFYGVLQVLAVAGPLWLAPGFATQGAVAGSLVLLQAGFLVSAYLRVAEIRTQCVYVGELPPPAPAPRETAPVPEAPPEVPPPALPDLPAEEPPPV